MNSQEPRSTSSPRDVTYEHTPSLQVPTEARGSDKPPSSSLSRSWPHLSSARGQYEAVHKPPPDCKRSIATGLDEAKCPSDEDYENPELQLLKAWPLMKILPARPIKESEYADTRYFKDVTEEPLLLHAKTSVPTERQSWSVGMRRPEVDKPKDIRSQCFKGFKAGGKTTPFEDENTSASRTGTISPQQWRLKRRRANGSLIGCELHTSSIDVMGALLGKPAPSSTGSESTKVNKIPLPPPRPPFTLLKKYQPLPPVPPETSPEAQRGPRQMSLKGFSEVLGVEKVSHHQIKLKPSQTPKSQNAQKTPPAMRSSSGTPSKHGMQDEVRTLKYVGPTGVMQSGPPQRCHSPASHSPPESVLPYENTSRGKPAPWRSAGKAIQQNEWYVGEYSRQAVEEALMKESKDGTFLVRDCSTKSNAEPYVLVVFHGNKVYNVKIRFLEKSHQFALGTGLRGTEKFDSVEDIIEHYKYSPIILIDGKDKAGVHRGQCYLTQPLALARHFPPW